MLGWCLVRIGRKVSVFCCYLCIGLWGLWFCRGGASQPEAEAVITGLGLVLRRLVVSLVFFIFRSLWWELFGCFGGAASSPQPNMVFVA